MQNWGGAVSVVAGRVSSGVDDTVTEATVSSATVVLECTTSTGADNVVTEATGSSATVVIECTTSTGADSATGVVSASTKVGDGERITVGELGRTIEATEERREVLWEFEIGDRSDVVLTEDCVSSSSDSRACVVRSSSCIARMVS